MTSSFPAKTVLHFIYIRSSCCTNWINTSLLNEDTMMSIHCRLITLQWHHHCLKYQPCLDQCLCIFTLPKFSRFYIIKKSITRSLIIFKKPRKMTNDFLNNYIFVHTFQWTLSEFLTNVTVTVKVAMVTYIHCKKG